MQVDFDPTDIRECRNHQCARRNIAVWAPGRSICSLCGAKLKGTNWRTKNIDDPIIDPLTKDGKGELIRAVHFSDFSGGLDEYMEYLEVMGIKNYVPYSDWYKVEKRPEGFDNTWDGYNKWLVSIGIAPRLDDTHRIRAITTVSRGPSKPSPAKADDTFTCATNEVKDCPIIGKAKIEMPNDMYQRWVYLAKVFDTEWIAYLKGARREDGVYEINEMYFPKQKANGSHVDAEDGELLEGTIGAVHSHVGMGAFFSTEDEKHMNHEIELVVNRAGDVATSVRVKLECGRYSRVKAEVTLMGNNSQREAVADLKSKLTENKPASTGYYQGNGYHSDGV